METADNAETVHATAPAGRLGQDCDPPSNSNLIGTDRNPPRIRDTIPTVLRIYPGSRHNALNRSLPEPSDPSSLYTVAQPQSFRIIPNSFCCATAI
jgi:hypothetical protein